MDLKRVFVLIDVRHGIKPSDKETLTLLDEAADQKFVPTKADKPAATELSAAQTENRQPSCQKHASIR